MTTRRVAACLAIGWLVSRLVLAWWLTHGQEWVTGDVGYFAGSLQGVREGTFGPGDVLGEYPFPAVVVVAVPWLLADAVGAPYGAVLLALAAATDLGFLVLLARAAHVRGTGWWSAGSWLLAVPAVGAISFARFDLLPGVLVAVAVLAIATSPRAAAVLLAIATAIKLWPVVLAPPLLAATGRRAAVWCYLGTGLGIAAATAAVVGPARLFSPLTYQVERGLQIESVAATPVMAARWWRPESWTVTYAPSKSFEVTGPLVDALLAATTLATLLYGLLVVAGSVALGFLWLRGRVVDAPTLVWCGLVGVLGFVVTGKVLSPQYLLWVLPLACAALVVADSLVLRRWVTGLLVAAALTQLVFPWGYGLLTHGVGPRVAVPVLALAGRNLLLAVLFAVAVGEAWRRVNAALRSPASRPVR